jgi:uncharacterized protein Usg
MNVFYKNPDFARMPNEIQNYIFRFLPQHPIIKILKPFIDEYEREDDEFYYSTFIHHIKFILAENESENGYFEWVSELRLDEV